MSFRLLGAPWWLRWPLLTLLSTLVLAVMWGFGIPGFGRTADLVFMVIASLVMGALLTAAQLPKHRAYKAALDGLSSEQRSQAVRSLSGGDVPADPAVLIAAMQIATVLAAGRQPTRRKLFLCLLVLASLSFTAMGQIAAGKVAQGLGWVVMVIAFAGAYAWDWYDVRRLQTRVEQLREAGGRLEATG